MASVEYTFQVILRMSRALGWPAAAVALIVCAAPAWADTVDYEIEVGLQAASHRLQGTQKVRWTNSTDTPTSDVYLHLYLNAFSSSQTTFMRELGWSSLRNRVEGTGDWGWTRIDRLVTSEGDDLLPAVEFVRPDDGNPGDFTVVRIPLPREVPPGSSVELEMDFEAQLPWIIARTGYVGDFHLVGQWFPKLGVFEGADGWN